MFKVVIRFLSLCSCHMANTQLQNGYNHIDSAIHVHVLYSSARRNHASLLMKMTPPPPLRTAYRLVLALRTAYRHFWASSTANRLTTKKHFWRFHLHKEIQITVCCMHMYNHSWVILHELPNSCPQTLMSHYWFRFWNISKILCDLCRFLN